MQTLLNWNNLVTYQNCVGTVGIVGADGLRFLAVFGTV